MVVVRSRRPDERDVDEVRVDPRHGRQLPVLRVVHEVARREQAPAVEVGEPVEVADPELAVGEAERSDVVRVPAPRDLVRLEVAHERGHVVDRNLLRVLAPGRLAAERVEPVRPRRAWDRAVPAIADGKLARQMVVRRQVAAVVVAHDHVDELRLLALLREVGDEAAHVVADLLGDARAAVAGILVLRERCPLEVPDLVVLAPIDVRHARLQPVDVGPPRFERQIPEHVVERPVLEHEHDDVVDLAEVGEGRVGREPPRVCAAP